MKSIVSRISKIACRIVFAYTKKDLLAFLKQMISTNDKWAIRALERIYQGQEADELNEHETKHLNNIGFNSNDAPILTSIYKSYKEHGNRMTPKMLALVKKMMQKYAGQLFRSNYFDMDKMNAVYEKWLEQNKKASKIAASARKINDNFVQEIQKAIQNNETISFDYLNKQGKTSLVTLTPSKIERKWGKQVVTGITNWGKEFSYLIDSMGSKTPEQPVQQVQEKTIVLGDDCDFKEEIKKAIDKGNKIQFTYLMKNGSRIKVTMKPVKIESKWSQDVCTGETAQGERSFLISSMGDNSLAKSELFKQYPELKGMMLYNKENGSCYFYKPCSIVNDKLECDKYDSKVYSSTYTDGDSEEGGRYGWEQEITTYKTYPGRVVGKELLEIKNGKFYLNNAEAKLIKSDHHLVRTERGELREYDGNGRGGFWRRH